VLVVADDLVRAAVVPNRQPRAAQSDLLEVGDGIAARLLAAQPDQPVLDRPPDSFGLGLPGEPGEIGGQALGLLMADVSAPSGRLPPMSTRLIEQ
jgi:hypothetical protein